MNKNKNRRSTQARRRKRVEISKQSAQTSQKNSSVFPLDFASPLVRMYAYALDLLFMYMIIVVTKQFFGDNIWTPEAAPLDIGILLGYFVLPTSLWGRTPGKFIIGVVVVDGDGYPCGLRGVPREVAGRFIAIAALLVGILWMLFDPEKQGWHDKLSGTYVVYNPHSGIFSWFRKKTTNDP